MPKHGRLPLHFGASDWETVVWVNGREVGQHRGGYDPFTFDITDALRPTDTNPKRERGSPAAENELLDAIEPSVDGKFTKEFKRSVAT
jgi:beta-galactosidase/beta-glucuronidase